VEAARLAGLNRVPAVVMSLENDAADLKAVDANIKRTNILPSELGRAFRLKLEALNRQGKRPEPTSVGNQLKSSRNSEFINNRMKIYQLHYQQNRATNMSPFLLV